MPNRVDFITALARAGLASKDTPGPGSYNTNSSTLIKPSNNITCVNPKSLRQLALPEWARPQRRGGKRGKKKNPLASKPPQINVAGSVGEKLSKKNELGASNEVTVKVVPEASNKIASSVDLGASGGDGDITVKNDEDESDPWA